ncbi:helix-turn-helix transcriptional regulator [Candidatus Saccharibacteria bacterium]|nr:helix-turn-helix transcriptional regulator [Candidatus Saccharibacteria bacterium]MBR6122526.1 helix-turn-helix transcriptional regulator [Candidatus Saccharibacteria bacterium]
MIFLNKTEADFSLWCKQIVPNMLADRRAFRNKERDVHEERERYEEVLAINRQLTAIHYLLDRQHTDFLDRHLIGGEDYNRTPTEAELYRDIYLTWLKVCFPKGSLGEQNIDNIALGHKLRELRQRKKFGVNRVCDLLGIAKQTFYAYEHGTCQIKLEVIYKLSRLYGFSIDEFLSGEDIIVTKAKSAYECQ